MLHVLLLPSANAAFAVAFCLCVYLSLCLSSAATFESLDLETSFLICVSSEFLGQVRRSRLGQWVKLGQSSSRKKRVRVTYAVCAVERQSYFISILQYFRVK